MDIMLAIHNWSNPEVINYADVYDILQWILC